MACQGFLIGVGEADLAGGGRRLFLFQLESAGAEAEMADETMRCPTPSTSSIVITQRTVSSSGGGFGLAKRVARGRSSLGDFPSASVWIVSSTKERRA